MTTELDMARTRRAVLAAALGAGAATVAAAVARPLPARADNGDTVTVGGSFTGTGSTTIDVGGNTGAVAFVGRGDGLGLLGQSDVGGGVRGEGTTYGVHGEGAIGVEGETGSGVGVKAIASTGIALQVAGKAKFSRSGQVNVGAGKTYVDVTVLGGLASGTVVVATLQTYRSGVAVAAVRKNYPSTGKIRIYLTKVASTTSSTAVGWFAAEH